MIRSYHCTFNRIFCASSGIFAIKGPEGNIEYLVHLKKEAEAEQAGVEESVDVQKVVDAAHGELDK